MTDQDDHFGEVLYSRYFQSRIVIVRFVDDKTWWFVVERGPYSGMIQEALTPYSEMPKSD